MHAYLRLLVIASIVLGFVFTLLGALANWVPALDLVNEGLPFLAAGAIFVLLLATATRERRLVLPAALIATINIIVLLGVLLGRAPEAASGSDRFLRVATFNLWGRNDRIAEVAAFLAKTDADVLVLQEVTPEHWKALRSTLEPRYPYRLGETGLLLLSKHQILADGRIDAAGRWWRSPVMRWARIEVNGTVVDIAGVHLARPSNPEMQVIDIAAVTGFARSRTGPVIIAGDFNLTPWTYKLSRFMQQTNLWRYNTLYFTWPIRWRGIQLPPLFAIDNVFASQRFASIATVPGPRLGSDHRAVIADIALAAPK